MTSNRYFNPVTLILVALLVISNAYWLYTSIDTAITLSYRDQQTYELDASLAQAQQLLPIAFGSPDKESFLTAAKQLLEEDSFDKNGCIWIGWLGFRFDDAGALAHVSRTWNFGTPDPCFSD